MTTDDQDLDFDELPDETAETRPGQEDLSLATDTLFAAFLKKAVAQLWPDDTVMTDFVTYVANPLSAQLGHVAAKGGEFVVQRQAAGKTVDERYTHDQSMRAHLMNGLFSVLHVAKTLQAWGAPQFRYYDEQTRRAFIAGYTLHDYLKLPEVESQLENAGFSHDQAVGVTQMPVIESIFLEWCESLGLDNFLASIGGSHRLLHDLIYISCNTQTRWGTLHNLRLLPQITLSPVQLELAEQLSRLADLLAYVGRTPQEAASHPAIHRELTTLSNGMARLTYHHLADNRGILTNFIQNAALSNLTHEYRLPFLYAPSGVVYLEHKQNAPAMPEPGKIAEAAIQRIRQVAGAALSRTRSGIQRDGKGMKYASYYWLFFDLSAFIPIGADATLNAIREGKNPSAGKRFTKMRDGQWMDPEVDLNLPDDLRVDQLAEWCYLAEKQTAEYLPGFDCAAFLLKSLGLENLQSQFAAVPRDNRAGGVGYHWYFAAGHYLKQHPGLDTGAWHERIRGFATQLAEAVQRVPRPGGVQRTDWDDLRDYILQILSSGQIEHGNSRDTFATELRRYSNAKRKGRDATRVCALCSSPYRVDKQREAAVLFAPQVYSNKRTLHSTDAIREICSICSIEMMLRQIFMKRSASSGGDFEGQRLRYLYFYPSYFFTPETLSILRRIHTALKRPSFTELSRQLIDEEGNVNFAPQTFQKLEPVLLTPEEEIDPANDRYLRMHFPVTEPVTFFFIGVPPPGKDAKDAEAWVHPAFLALLLPLCLDIKVVASEASLPLFLEADEFTETVFLDGPHPAIHYLTQGQARVNVDRVLPTLQRLTVGYLIQMDANSKMGTAGFDYRWQDLPALARAISESSLYAFHYLKKWQRKQQRDSLPTHKVRLYLHYIDYLNGDKDMSHAKELTLLYRQFYRAKRYNSNSILRPISIAAHIILDADPRLFDADGLVEAVYGGLRSYSERAQVAGLAYFPKGSNSESRTSAMRAFANYFVNEIFYKTLRGDKSALRGKQLNLLKNACEIVYLDEAERDRSDRELAEKNNDESSSSKE